MIALVRWTGLGKVRIFEAVHHGLLALLKPSSVEYDGHRFWLDAYDNCGLSYKRLHNRELTFLESQIVAGETIVDVGANIGLYAVKMAACTGPAGHVYAFEPEPLNYQHLCMNVEANQLRNVTTIPKAASDEPGTARLFLSKSHGGQHRLHPSTTCSEAIEIETIRLDDYFLSTSQTLDMVKIDVEGHEFRVLSGMEQLLNANRRLRLFIEFCPAWLAEAGQDGRQLLDLLTRQGFAVYDVVDGHPVETTFTELQSRYPISRRSSTNLWCVRNEVHGRPRLDRS